MPVLQPAVLKGKIKVPVHNQRAFLAQLHQLGAPKRCAEVNSRVNGLFSLKTGEKTIFH
ncbi:hypothetical protein [Cronobacter condimenti]|uniref:hypothetical protein n=1 Tax=Cronobacter condimenti TaxID=1163710 RepID=UPI00130DB6F3|nr:hypothetical protein [Cronobacter condimenti]